jgi:hypothetical protein
MFSPTDEQNDLIWRAAKLLGYEPMFYQVREISVVHVKDAAGNSRYWNPLDPMRQDFFEVFAFVLNHNSLVIQPFVGRQNFPKFFCEQITRYAVGDSFDL